MNKSLSTTAGQNYSSLASIRHAASTSQLVDIFITDDWPASITSHCSSPPPLPEYEHSGSPPLDDVIRKIKPRYHFAARAGSSSKFWEREPFAWDDESGRITRFISLGAFGEEHTGQKQRVCRSARKDVCDDPYFRSGSTRSPSSHQQLQRNGQAMSQRILLRKLLFVYPSESMKTPKGKTLSSEISTTPQSVLDQVCLGINTWPHPLPCYWFLQKRRMHKPGNLLLDTSASDVNQARLVSTSCEEGASSWDS